MVGKEIVTFDFIFSCWEKGEYPDGFDDLLYEYLEKKAEIFSDVSVKEVTSWLSKVLVAIEIGLYRDPPRFEDQKRYWKDVLGRDWNVSVEDRWVEWA